MAKIVLLINSSRYSYHTAVSSMIASCLRECQQHFYILDTNSEAYDHRCLAKIKKANPDILLTLDLAGFHIRTQAGENALNMLPTKNLNLVWGNKPEYAALLHKKISLSMLFYDVTGIDHHLPALYPDLLYYKVLGAIPPEAPDSPQAREAFAQIWADFIREVLLSEG